MSSQRREQIVEAAVRVVAREGSHGLSFAKVVQEAGLSSTRLISYHFGTREALLAQTFEHVLARAAAFMGPQIAAQTTVRAKIGTYIRSNLEFIATDPVYARAAIDLAGAVGAATGGGGLALLEDGFRRGQEAGELRAFDVHTAAVALRGAIDATVLDIVNAGADTGRAAAELAELVDRAIRA
ncbi:TetR/AcrR family transcriptional regulator [Actinomadura montaniterrae]|uniref:TetR/AcrR family transcriptional regulator n=1 Tax=Actinomadura montaniterrae TaxID=1803903 RepID=UPI001CEF6012|nr:TetR/AcrR family transcriptional regulator [Actinomadura montaniterrae]